MMKKWSHMFIDALRRFLSGRNRRVKIIFLILAGLFLGILAGLLTGLNQEMVEDVKLEVQEEEVMTDQEKISLSEPLDLSLSSYDFIVETERIEEPSYPLAAYTAPEKELDFEPLTMILPSQGEIVTGYGWYRHPRFGDWRYHPGLSFQVKGDPLKASLGGRVIEVSHDAFRGYWVVLDHGQDIQTGYGFSGSLLVEYGQVVEKGDIIALSSTEVMAPSLFFQVMEGEDILDPFHYFDGS